MDMGQAYLELKDEELNEAYAEWVRRQRGQQGWWDRILALLLGRKHAHSLKTLMMTDEERARRHDRQIDLRLWQRFATDTAAEGAPMDHRSEAFPRFIIHPHSPWKIAWFLLSPRSCPSSSSPLFCLHFLCLARVRLFPLPGCSSCDILCSSCAPLSACSSCDTLCSSCATLSACSSCDTPLPRSSGVPVLAPKLSTHPQMPA